MDTSASTQARRRHLRSSAAPIRVFARASVVAPALALALALALTPAIAPADAGGARGAAPATGAPEQPPLASTSAASALTGVDATPLDSASLTRCVTIGEQSERSATFAGEMSTIVGATRMAMRIELLEQMEGESHFHAVAAPGLGAWHTADPGVGVYKYVKQFTNLSAPAVYRGLVTFRWLGPHGRTFKREERRTRPCVQPAPPSSPPSPSGSAPPSTPQPTSSPPAVE